MGMKITRSIYGKNQELELTRDELKKAYQEYDFLVAREQTERFLLNKKGVRSLDAYEDVINRCVSTYRKNRQGGKDTAAALLDAIEDNFRYMEQTPTGPVELYPGFISAENFEQMPDRICFCPHGMTLNREHHGFTGNDFMALSDDDRYTAKALFRFCTGEGCSMQPQYVMKNPALASKIREIGKQLELKDRSSLEDVEHQLSWQRGRAAAIYETLEREFGSEPDELSLALDIRYFMRQKDALGLSVQDAALLSQRLSQTEQSHPVSHGMLLQAVCTILKSGIDREDYPVLPSMDKDAARKLLLTADQAVFESAVSFVATALQRRDAHDAASKLLTEDYTPLYDAAKAISESDKPALDDQMKVAEARTSPRPTSAPVPDAAREQ